MEAEVKVISRAKDTKLVERAADSAKRQYAEISGRDVSIFIEGGLPDSLWVRTWIKYREICCPLSSAKNVITDFGPISLGIYIFHSAGGVKVVSGNGRISLDNTLDERLRLLESRVRIFSIPIPILIISAYDPFNLRPLFRIQRIDILLL